MNLLLVARRILRIQPSAVDGVGWVTFLHAADAKVKATVRVAALRRDSRYFLDPREQSCDFVFRQRQRAVVHGQSDFAPPIRVEVPVLRRPGVQRRVHDRLPHVDIKNLNRGQDVGGVFKDIGVRYWGHHREFRPILNRIDRDRERRVHPLCCRPVLGVAQIIDVDLDRVRQHVRRDSVRVAGVVVFVGLVDHAVERSVQIGQPAADGQGLVLNPVTRLVDHVGRTVRTSVQADLGQTHVAARVWRAGHVAEE